MRVGIVSPGDMGSAIAGRLIGHGFEVFACLDERSERTRALARSVGIRSLPDFDALTTECDQILSIVVPSHAADVGSELAQALARTGSKPLVVDFNAISPTSVADIGSRITEAGGRFVDGCIVGRPPRTQTNTVIFVSGPHAHECEPLGLGGLRLKRVGEHIGDASALKMSYSALTKGIGILGTQLLVAARSRGVYESLVEIMAENVPEFFKFFENRVPEIPSKAHRFVGEMRELEGSMVELGLPGGTFASFAKVCEWLASTPLAAETPETRDLSRKLTQVVDVLMDSLTSGEQT